MSGKQWGKWILKSWSESVNHCLNKLEGHHFKRFHFPVAVPSPLISFSEVQFFIPVKTLMAPWTKLPSPLVNACIRLPNKCGQASGQSQYAMAEIAYAWKYIVEICINLQVLSWSWEMPRITSHNRLPFEHENNIPHLTWLYWLIPLALLVKDDKSLP